MYGLIGWWVGALDRAACGSLWFTTQPDLFSFVFMVGDICSRSVLPRKYCPSSTTKEFSTTTLRIMALLGDRVNYPLHTNREIIEISQFFIEILGFEVCQSQPVKRGILAN